jgi:exodeoxyribonuclease VII large subunit
LATTRELALLHPQQIMERGYAMVIDRATGVRMQSATVLHPSQDVLLRFHDGMAGATVTGVDLLPKASPATLEERDD